MKISSLTIDISNFIFPINSRDIFNNNNNTALEIGFGEGEFLVDLALSNQDWNFVGIEIKKHRNKVALKLAEDSLISNIRFLHIEAEIALRQVLDRNIFHTVYINFPDPWPKRRHFKHRLFNQEFIKSLSKVLVIGGKVIVKTDHYDYILQIIDEFNKSETFTNGYGNKGYIVDKYNTKTKFESEFRDQGKEIFSTSFTNLSN